MSITQGLDKLAMLIVLIILLIIIGPQLARFGEWLGNWFSKKKFEDVP
jgi:Sec-independent protein translocase protein TatA